jgi:glutathione synthase/RimK-type ligase-like ATP-grasp enzyme
MKKVVFLTMDSLENFECYDYLLTEPFNQIGWKVEEISWRKGSINWNGYDAVIVRSTWDYQTDYQKFLRVLEDIERSSAVLFNDFKTLKWNMNKTYLRDLQQRGINTVPTIWEKEFMIEKFKDYFNHFRTDEIIIKPNISANADNTFLLKQESFKKFAMVLNNTFKSRDFMVQPFIKNIISEGEYSLFYFNGVYSHAILKTPKENDFRVQEEHGGSLIATKIDQKKQNLAEKIINHLSPVPLYARIDLVRTDKDDFTLMELELIEPSLYFQLDKDSPKRFVKAFDTRMRGY